MTHAHHNETTTETDQELQALVHAGCFASTTDAGREAVQTWFAVKPSLRVKAAPQLYQDEARTLGRAAELADVTR